MDHNGGVTTMRLVRCPLHRLGWRGRVAAITPLMLVFLLAGCSAGVNQQLLQTPTPRLDPTPASAAVVAATPSGAVSAALATAESALRAGDPSESERVLSTVVALQPERADALALRAEARRRRGDLTGAAADLGTARALDPRRIDLVLARGQVAAQQPDFAVATDAFTEAIRLDPGNADAYVERATATLHQAQGDLQAYQAALDDLNRAIAIDSSHPRAHLGRARVYFDRATYRGSPDDLTRTFEALDGLPQGRASEEATLLRARALALGGESDAALEMLDRPVLAMREATPLGPAARQSARAEIALASNDGETAARAAAAAIAADPAAWSAYYALGEAELLRGDPATALQTIGALLDRWPDNGRALYLRGAALMAAGRTEEGAQALTVARERLGSSPVYLARIEQLLQGREDREPLSAAMTGHTAYWSVRRRATTPAR